mmetsp:Transcript_65590/g.143864  ORF Transcript_65590/g.143864 Transcript_65590/m.143864 type:complete len:214 (+) Transcript_65590:209-850(+)
MAPTESNAKINEDTKISCAIRCPCNHMLILTRSHAGGLPPCSLKAHSQISRQKERRQNFKSKPTAKDFHHFTQISFHKYKMVSRQSNSTTVRALHPNAKGSPGWPHSEGRAGRMQHATKDMPMGGMATKPMLKISRELPEKITVSMCTFWLRMVYQAPRNRPLLIISTPELRSPAPGRSRVFVYHSAQYLPLPSKKNSFQSPRSARKWVCANW